MDCIRINDIVYIVKNIPAKNFIIIPLKKIN